MQFLGFPAIALASAMLLVEARAATSGVLSSRTLRLLGKYSYGIYVYHGLLRPSAGRALQWLTSPTGGYADVGISVAFVIVASLLSIGIAALSFHAFESRFLEMKDRLFARPNGRGSLATSTSRPPAST
jgi:peptidoglycan/LPS O-acetylase OafA/YrhL